MSNDYFVDAEEVGDELYLALLDHALSNEERAFRDVLVFHRDVLNGGLSQALYNCRSELKRYANAFRMIGAAPLGDLIAFSSRIEEAGDLETITDAYVGCTYNLAYVCAHNQTDSEFTFRGDQVERMALRYARANCGSFSAVLGALDAGKALAERDKKQVKND